MIEKVKDALACKLSGLSNSGSITNPPNDAQEIGTMNNRHIAMTCTYNHTLILHYVARLCISFANAKNT